MSPCDGADGQEPPNLAVAESYGNRERRTSEALSAGSRLLGVRRRLWPELVQSTPRRGIHRDPIAENDGAKGIGRVHLYPEPQLAHPRVLPHHRIREPELPLA